MSNANQEWSQTPPPKNAPCTFMAATRVGDVWEFDIWKIAWSPDDYWMLLDSEGEEWGCIDDDFPLADYYAIVRMPPTDAVTAKNVTPPPLLVGTHIKDYIRGLIRNGEICEKFDGITLEVMAGDKVQDVVARYACEVEKALEKATEELADRILKKYTPGEVDHGSK